MVLELENLLLWLLGACLALTLVFAVKLFRAKPPLTTGVVFLAAYVLALVFLPGSFGILLVPIVIVAAVWLWGTCLKYAPANHRWLLGLSVCMLGPYLWIWHLLLSLYRT